MELLALEAALVERLREQMPAGVAVRRLREIADIESKPVPTPALYVSYAGGSVSESRSDGRASRIAQRWLITAVVRNVANASDGAAKDDAGPLVDAALDALMGWQPEGTSQPATLSALPAPGFGGGYLWLPIEVSTEFVRRAPARLNQ